MEFKDCYKTLGVERTSSDADIKKAFRRLARKHHPDINRSPDAQSRMQALNEANLQNVAVMRELIDEIERLRAQLQRAGIAAS